MLTFGLGKILKIMKTLSIMVKGLVKAKKGTKMLKVSKNIRQFKNQFKAVGKQNVKFKGLIKPAKKAFRKVFLELGF